jgi:ABC-2 type transport system ATP-binding protein
VALIQEGKILDIDSPKGITGKFNRKLWAVRGKDMYRLMLTLKAMDEVYSCYPFGQEHHVVFKGESVVTEGILDKLRERGQEDIRFKEIEAGIEDCFMSLMNE